MVNRKPDSLPVRKNKKLETSGRTKKTASRVIVAKKTSKKSGTRTGRKSAKKLTYAKSYQEYLDGKIKLETYQKIGVLLLIVVFAGFAGWVWEFALSEIGGRFHGIYIEGGNLLPWINIYAYGAILIMLVSCKLKKHPWAVFLVSGIACGLLEWFAGWIVYTVGNGTRYWNYSDSWWAIGNIDGFVCPASATAFGLGALLLMYFLLPRVIYMARVMTRRAFLALAVSLFTVVMVDDVVSLALKNLGMPTAHDFYRSLGWEYKPN